MFSFARQGSGPFMRSPFFRAEVGSSGITVVRRAATQPRSAFTMIEVCAVLGLIAMLIALLLPAVQSARETARRTSCANNLLQVALGVRAYQSSFGHYPMQMHGTDGSTQIGLDNDRRLSFLVGVLPFVGQQSLYEQIGQPIDRSWVNPDRGGAMLQFGDSVFDGGSFLDGEQSFSGGGETSFESADTAGASTETLGGNGIGTVNGQGGASRLWPQGGPEPFQWNYRYWNVELGVFRCPSDPGLGSPAFARNNYTACLGDGLLASASGPFREVNGSFVTDDLLLKQTNAAMRGAFIPRMRTSDEDIKDGISQTILLGEIKTALGDDNICTMPVPGPGSNVLRDNPGWASSKTTEMSADLIDPEIPTFWKRQASDSKLGQNRGQRRGLRWADGMPLYTGFNTILPPNREIVMSEDRDDCWGVLGASSYHQGGAHVAMVDASVRFVADSIDAGNAGRPSVYVGSESEPGSGSPYGVWGALGTRASSELSPQMEFNRK